MDNDVQKAGTPQPEQPQGEELSAVDKARQDSAQWLKSGEPSAGIKQVLDEGYIPDIPSEW